VLRVVHQGSAWEAGDVMRLLTWRGAVGVPQYLGARLAAILSEALRHGSMWVETDHATPVSQVRPSGQTNRAGDWIGEPATVLVQCCALMAKGAPI
jgi:hypothetical protein